MFDSVPIKNSLGATVQLPAILNSDGQTYIMNTTMPWNDLIAMRLVPGVSSLDKWGVTLTTSVSAPVDIWEGVGEYEFETTNSITHIRAVNIGGAEDADNGKTIELLCQLADGTEFEQSKAVGDDDVFIALDTPCSFVARMTNLASAKIEGSVQASVGTSAANSNQKAYIIDGNNQTQMAIYRVPKEKVIFLKRGEVGLNFSGNPSAGTQYLIEAYRSKRPGEDWTIKKSISGVTSATSNYEDRRIFKDIIPSLTEFKLSVMESSDATIGANGAFDLEIWDESLFSDEWLAAIGQPGY